MLTCTNCGASVREGARFCTTCGTRLNDPVATDATSVWATPVVSQSTAPEEASTAKSGPGIADATTDTDTDTDDTPDAAGSEAMAEESARPDDGQDTSDEPAEAEEASSGQTATADEGFTWSWGRRDAAADAQVESDQVDEESGVVLEEAESVQANASDEGDELVDATEIEILEVEDQVEDDIDGQATGLDEEAGAAPETSDAVLVVDDEEEDGGESETLAAWAEQWQTPEADDTTTNDVPGEPEIDAQVESDQIDPVVAAHGTDAPAPDDEDTVAKADRLIGELRAMIPSLMRPMPAAPANVPDPSPLADELELAARAGQFDDLRETLAAARAHPRDVDTMLNLSSKIDRLIELLDDRDSLADTAQRAATRLRPTADPADQ